jgi:membrane-associated protease RseP (regulator of RpoE activity)
MTSWESWLLLSVFGFSLAGCASSQNQVRRLNPARPETVTIPKECRLVSVLKGSPAERAGLTVGTRLHAVNGVIPADASAVSDLIGSSPADLNLEILTSSGTPQPVAVRLNATRPRLGAVCDLTGFRKMGITAAGNESLTVFDGPFAVTASGIIDKGIVFARVRVTNNSDHPIVIGPELFSAKDGGTTPLPILSPQQVMCDFYGDKGAHSLFLKRQRNQSVDAQIPGKREYREEPCPAGRTTGRLSSSNAAYLEANADYLAAESLWPASFAPGQTADGLIYVKEPSTLPVVFQSSIEGYGMTIVLGKVQASRKEMKSSERIRFFESQKKGAALRVTLRKTRVFVGKLESYDSDNEKAWFYSPSGKGLLNTVGFPLRSIRSVEAIEAVSPKPEPTSTQMP